MLLNDLHKKKVLRMNILGVSSNFFGYKINADYEEVQKVEGL